MKVQTAPPARWLSVKSAAAYCGVSDRTLETWDAKGLIRSSNVVMPGASKGRRLIDRESLDAFIESHIATPPAVLAMNGKKGVTK